MAPDDNWRAHWAVDETGLQGAHLVHASGLRVHYVYTELDDDGAMGWVEEMTAADHARADRLSAERGSDVVAALYEQARVLWNELGHRDGV